MESANPQSIGYIEFRELRCCLQWLFRARARPASRLQHKVTDLASSQCRVLSKVLAMELQYLTEGSQHIDLADFDRAVDILLAGRRVFVFASGPSCILADLAMGFQHLSPEILAVLDHAQATGCRSILLTDTLWPVLGAEAEVTLAARRGPVSTFHSPAAPMSVLNALILAVAMARPDESLPALHRLQQLHTASGLEIPDQVSGKDLGHLEPRSGWHVEAGRRPHRD
jgi:DNA-binding MurR/RpiR family transcriptional regulator